MASKVKWWERLNRFTSQRKTLERRNQSKRERERKWIRDSSRWGRRGRTMAWICCCLCLTRIWPQTWYHFPMSAYTCWFPTRCYPEIPHNLTSSPRHGPSDSPSSRVTCLALRHRHGHQWHFWASGHDMAHAAHRASSHVFAVPLSWVTVGFWDAILEKSTLPALQFSEVCKDGARDDGHFVLMSSYKWDTKLSIFIARLDTSKDGEQNCESHGARLLWEVKGFGPFWHFWQLSHGKRLIFFTCCFACPWHVLLAQGLRQWWRLLVKNSWRQWGCGSLMTRWPGMEVFREKVCSYDVENAEVACNCQGWKCAAPIPILRARAYKATQRLSPGACPGTRELVLILGWFCSQIPGSKAVLPIFSFKKHQEDGADSGRASDSGLVLLGNSSPFQTPSSPSLCLMGFSRPGKAFPSPLQAPHEVNTLSRGARSWLSLTFGFKSKVTVLADIWPDVCVRANVFLQHAGFLAANSTLLTYILPSSTASHIHILFVWFVPMSNRCHDKKKKKKNIPTSKVVTTFLG